MSKGLKVIAPEFEIDVDSVDGKRTVVSIIDIKKGRITHQKVINKPVSKVINKVRSKIGEVIE